MRRTDYVSHDGFDIAVTITPQAGAPQVDAVSIVEFIVKKLGDTGHDHVVELDICIRTSPRGRASRVTKRWR